MKRLYLFVLGMLGLFVFAQIIFFERMTISEADSLNPGIYSVNSSPFGSPYSNWIGKWWNWTAGIIAAEHPRDFAERSCDKNQEGPVWFLPDILTGQMNRTCIIPFGKAIFVPISTGEMSVAEDPETFRGVPVVKTKLSSIAGECDSYETNKVVEVDGIRLKGYEGLAPPTYRANSTGLFNITWNKDSLYEVKDPPPVSPAFADGWFLFLEPPARGDHIIKYMGGIDHPTKPSCNTSFDVTWNIKVQ